MNSEGLSEAVIKDCEQIMQSEFSEFQRQLKLRYEEQLHLLGTFRQQLEDVNVEEDSRTIREGSLQLMKNEFSSSGHGKYSEYSATESSEDVEKQEADDSSDEECCFFDTKEGFAESPINGPSLMLETDHCNTVCRSENHGNDLNMMHIDAGYSDLKFPHVERRKELPQPIEKEKGVSLWSIIKDNVGKDLTRICLPVYFNEPLSSLQKCFEDLEYSYLLDRAYEYGKMGNSVMRMLNIAAFAVSGYASTEGRPCKPFNPLLGETYEADFPEKGLRFFSEKVSHHPMLIACHCEGRGWRFWGDSNVRSKFWGRSIQLDPLGVLTLEFDDGEIFQWSKVTTSIYNLILGKIYCDHHGTMSIQGNRQYSCKLKFKEQSLLDRNPRQVQGFVEDTMGNKVAALIGKWDDSMYYITGDDVSKTKLSTENATLLWKRNKPPENPTRYNLSSFAITLNELTPNLQGKLPPTDSRLRPDQRYLENGEYEKAFAEKLRLETRQRMSRKLQENGWKPRWFQKDDKTGTFRYIGGYWEARDRKKWEDCPNIFGEFSVDQNVTNL
ncbi:oxysterol-binding protein-related protein 2A-like isoform X2 [Asparagus officinalis]|nr:oxysterol-binding protein-related protein 2A-like isoform X2 [Asparagus officinalis]